MSQKIRSLKIRFSDFCLVEFHKHKLGFSKSRTWILAVYGGGGSGQNLPTSPTGPRATPLITDVLGTAEIRTFWTTWEKKLNSHIKYVSTIDYLQEDFEKGVISYEEEIINTFHKKFIFAEKFEEMITCRGHD